MIISIVEFRMIMFRPVEGEILVGKVHSSNQNGIRVSLEFMDDVWIPKYNCTKLCIFFIGSTGGKWI